MKTKKFECYYFDGETHELLLGCIINAKDDIECWDIMEEHSDMVSKNNYGVVIYDDTIILCGYQAEGIEELWWPCIITYQRHCQYVEIKSKLNTFSQN